MHNIKMALLQYFRADDLLYVEIYMKNGMNFRINEPKRENGIKLEVGTEYLRIYGDIDENRKIDTCVPYENVSYVSAGFGKEEIVSNEEE
ncbi:MAG: hypothetical protein BZ138_06115 [Methanosphaera sp. rholeuAM270]|nr:MAG: hypothetical protein BZ138_06115 [Methanosphaera sp. rholeuAM270]